MEFQNYNHSQRYHELLGRMKSQDAYHKAAAYLMALSARVPDDVFDFEDDSIKHAGLFAGWQTGSTRRATRLMFSLWNGCHQDLADDQPEETS